MDPAPNCAVCNAPAYPECPCESKSLEIAVKQAEKRAMESRMVEIRDWVIRHAREHVLHRFEHLTATRKVAHATYLSSLPYYQIYMQYSGHPPLHPVALAQLQAQISEAHAELKRGIDADWRASVLRYPEVLDYFFSLVELRLPNERSPKVLEPPFAAGAYPEQLYEKSREKKKHRRDRESLSPDEKRPKPKREDSSYVVTGHARRAKAFAAPPAPTPPLAGGYPMQGAGYARPFAGF